MSNRFRQFLKFTIPVYILAAFFHPQVLRAQETTTGNTEWQEGFDVSNDDSLVVKELTPISGPRSVAATEMAIAQYKEIVAKGGWNQVPAGEVLRTGAQSSAVTALRRRLMVSGDLKESIGQSDVFDVYVMTAVKRFQARHGLVPDGVVRASTFTALNVPAEERLRQLELNLPRLKAIATDLGDRYVLMNIPATQLEAVQDGTVVQRHGTVVGKIDRQSPILAVKIAEINFNPFWTVPGSIVKKDLIPKMQKDPNYLTEQGIRIFDQKGNELSPNWINWSTTEAINFNFKQDPSDINSMGSMRIGMPNTENVYMHDTPQKALFGEDARFHSSGCARIQNVRDLVTWLLANNPEWPRERIDQAVRTNERTDVKLAKPVPVYWVYITAWANEEGAQFRDDIYGRDKMHMAGDFHLPATPFDKVGPQAFIPGTKKAVHASKPDKRDAKSLKRPKAEAQNLQAPH
jgi:murein L,D-transpeptidase YcbB/YkuD